MTRKKRRRMTLPKKKEDIEKVVEEVQETHAHEHAHEHHHHHHHTELDELLYAIDLHLEALNQRVRVLEDRVRRQQIEIATLYKVLARVVEACLGEGSEEEKRKAVARALAVLRAPRIVE